INPVCGCPGVLTWSGRNGLSQYAHNFDYNNFGPRVGFAWRASEKWVLRGGASVVYAGEYDFASPTVVNTGFGAQGSFVSPDGGRTAAFILLDGMPAAVKASENDLKPGYGAVPIGQNPILAVQFFEPDERATPFLETFNFNIATLLLSHLLF